MDQNQKNQLSAATLAEYEKEDAEYKKKGKKPWQPNKYTLATPASKSYWPHDQKKNQIIYVGQKVDNSIQMDLGDTEEF